MSAERREYKTTEFWALAGMVVYIGRKIEKIIASREAD